MLQYLGMLVALGSLLALLAIAEQDHGRGGLLLASAVALAATGALAEALRRRGEWLPAGLVSVVAVLMFGTVVGTIVDLLGLFPDDAPDESGFFTEGFPFGVLILEVAVMAAALYARRRFAFPFHTFVFAAALWYPVMDLLEGVVGGGNTGTAVLAILVGLGFVAAGAANDEPEHDPSAFWLHLVGALSVGGGIVWFWHDSAGESLLVMLVSLAYVLAARRWARSSYAVLGALGLAAATTYFVERWFSEETFIPFVQPEGDNPPDWGRPLMYLLLGVVYMLLGWLVGPRRRPEPPGEVQQAP